MKKKIACVHKYTPGQPVGLINFGSSCFLNVVLQILLVHPFIINLNNDSQCNDEKLKTLILNFKKNKNNEKEIYDYIKKWTDFNKNNQNAADELLGNILDRLLPIPEDSSNGHTTPVHFEIHKSFYVEEDSAKSNRELSCENTPLLNIIPPSNSLISTKTLTDLIDTTLNVNKIKEKLDIPTETHNEEFKLEYIPEDNLPNVLTLSLQRLLQNDHSKSPFLVKTTFDVEETLTKNEKQYHLTAVGCHTLETENGSSGHYFSYININDLWYCCNDLSITQVKTEDVLTAASTNGVLFIYDSTKSNIPTETDRLAEEEYNKICRTKKENQIEITKQIIYEHDERHARELHKQINTTIPVSLSIPVSPSVTEILMLINAALQEKKKTEDT